MFQVTVTMRDGTTFDCVSDKSLSERQWDGELDGQFVIFTGDSDIEIALPADDIAEIKSEETLNES